ncbi:MAG TPA: hypothetical protein VMT63_02695 [Bacteroidales bacterium]|nr:hypothetical protein [Bacteroidales bacterium]
MPDKDLQEQIDEINRKLDLLLEETAIQRQSREAVNDLVDDVAVIGKDVFRDMVNQLDNAGIELDGDAVRTLVIRLIRNIDNLGMVLETIESLNDLMKDLAPIVRQAGLDGINKFHELEQKGYFEILNQLSVATDTIVSRYPREDIMKLSGNLVPVADTLFKLADKGFLEKLGAISVALSEIKTEEIEEYSVWRMIKELNKPQVRKSIGFIMAFLTKINEQNIRKQ